MAALGELLLKLGIDSAQLREGLEEAAGQLRKFAKRADAVGKSLEHALTASIGKDVVVGLAQFVSKGAEAADAMGKLATSVGVPLEQFSRLGYAADFAGVSTQDLGTGLKVLGKNMSEAFGGGKDPAALFKALGISITDSSGKLRSSGDVMADVAEKFSGMEDGAAKATLAQELFGKQGTALIPLLNDGKEGLAAMGEEADRLGFTLTGQAAASAAEFNDSLARLKKVGEGVSLQLASNLAPTLKKLTDELFGAAGKSEVLDATVRVLAAGFRGLLAAGIIVGAVLQTLGRTIGRVLAGLQALTEGNFKGGAETLRGAFGESLKESIDDAGRQLKALGTDSEAPKDPTGGIGEKAKESADKYVKAASRIKNAGTDLANAQKKAAADLARELERQAKEHAKVMEELGRIELGGKRANEQISAQAAKHAEDFASAGMSDEQKFAAATAGFASFEEAAAAWQAKMREHQAKLDDVAALRALGDEELANESQIAADRLAELAKSFADAMEAFKGKKEKDTQKAEEKKQEAKKRDVSSVAGSLETALLDSLHPVGAALVSAGKSIAMGGNAMQALGTVVIALIANSAGLRQLFDSLGGVLQALADIVGALLEPFAPMIQQVGGLVAQLLSFVVAFNPMGILFKIVGKLFEAFAPILAIFAFEMEALTPLLDMLINAFITLNPVFLALSAGARILFEGVKWVSVGILKIAIAFADTWNRMVAGIQTIFTRILDKVASLIGNDAVRPVRDAVAGIAAGVTVSTDKMQDAVRQLESTTYDSAMNLANGMNKAATAAAKVSESFLNMPSGFKMAAARFGAMDSPAAALGSASAFGNMFGDVPRFAEGARVTGPTFALLGEGGEPETVIPDSKLAALLGDRGGVTIQANFYGVTDIRDAWEKLKRLAEREGIALTGTPVPVGPRLTRSPR